MTERVVVVADDAPIFADWVDGTVTGDHETPCPVVSIEHIEAMGLKVAGYADLSRAWAIPRIDAVRALMGIEDSAATAYVYDEEFWSGVAPAKRTRKASADQPEAEPEPDETVVRRSALATILAEARDPAPTREALAAELGVSIRTTQRDLIAVGAERVVVGKIVTWKAAPQ